MLFSRLDRPHAECYRNSIEKGNAGTMNLVSEQALYRKINFLRFVAILCVLLAHSENYLSFGFLEGTIAFEVEHDVLASMEWVVSCFFMLSSMLFFRHFQWNQLLGKWKRRVHTLLIPYLLWNTVYFCLFALLPRIPFLAPYINTAPAPLTVASVLNAIFLHEYAGFLWFIKVLILLTLLAPLFYVLFSKKYIAEISLALFLRFVFHPPIHLPDILSINWRFFFFYAVGAYVSLRAPDAARLTAPRPLRYVLLCAIPIYAYIHTFFINEIYSISVIACLWFGINADTVPETSLYETSFFLYLTHFLLFSIIKKIQFALVPHTQAWMLISYFTVAPITVLLLIPLAQYLRRSIPKTYAFLFGGR